MDSKIRINLKEGLVEAEGSEEFVKYIFECYKDNIGHKTASAKPNKTINKKNDDVKKGKSSKRRSQSVSKTPKIVSDLNLRPNNDNPTLDDYYKSLNVGNNAQEQNLVFIYYMQKILGLTAITMDSVYTCYKHLKVKVPGNLYQSLIDTKNKKGWIDTSNTEQLRVTVPGENFVEHNMRKK